MTWLCEDTDGEFDTADEALKAFHNMVCEDFYDDYDRRQSPFYRGYMPTIIAEIDNHGKEIMKLPAWADTGDYGFDKEGTQHG